MLDSRLPAGETRRLFAKTQFVVSAAHPDVVLLEMNGQAMPSLTSCGAVRYNGAQPERLEAGTQWKRSALNSSKTFATAALRRENKIAVCTGGAQLNPVDRAEILAVLAADPDAAVVKHAEEAALTQPIESFVEAIKRSTATPFSSHMLPANSPTSPASPTR